MAITLTGNTGFFTRAGRMISGMNECFNFEGTTSNNRAAIVASGFQTGSQPEVIDGLYAQLASLNSANTGGASYYSQLVGADIVAQALEQADPPITSADTTSALIALIDQMTSTAQSIEKPTLSSSVSYGSSNVGNGVAVVSLLNGEGVQKDMVFGETITLTCTADGYPGGGATAGQEPFAVNGEIAVSDLAWNWPHGSGASTSTNTIDPAATGGIITNGSFDDWPNASGAPVGWTISTGTVPTTVQQGSPSFNGGFALQINGNGSELTTLRQAVSLSPNTVYPFNVWLRSGSGSVAAGVVRFQLINSDGNTTVNDQAGNPIAFSKSVPALTTSYESFSGTISTPTVLPTSLAWEISLTTAITSGQTLLIDDIQIAADNPAYAGGPVISVFRGATDWAVGDQILATITTDGGIGSFGRSLDRIFNLRQLGLQIPSASSPTIPNSLITVS